MNASRDGVLFRYPQTSGSIYLKGGIRIVESPFPSICACGRFASCACVLVKARAVLDSVLPHDRGDGAVCFATLFGISPRSGPFSQRISQPVVEAPNASAFKMADFPVSRSMKEEKPSFTPNCFIAGSGDMLCELL